MKKYFFIAALVAVLSSCKQTNETLFPAIGKCTVVEKTETENGFGKKFFNFSVTSPAGDTIYLNDISGQVYLTTKVGDQVNVAQDHLWGGYTLR